MKALTALFFSISIAAAAQGPQVPSKMQFAGMTLAIRDDARKEIQKDVDAMTLSPKHFNIKVERAKTYFPLIEKVFAEESVPDDFKFLVLQESSLIADAVSVSNAVGFWQFKDYTALEMGLRVDKEVDERMNIISSSRAAARYIKKNNLFFDNWLYALQAYQMGAGAVMRSVKDSQSGTKHMEITSATYWYVKKYLAHKIAYEDAVNGPGQIRALTYDVQTQRSLADVCKEMAADEEELKTYNKWLKTSTIPSDRVYTVVIPVRGDMNVTIPEPSIATAKLDGTKASSAHHHPRSAVSGDKKKINGILVIPAIPNETPTQLAARGGVDLSEFLKWNEISISEKLVPGRSYFLGKKRAKASQAYHTVAPGESLWSISQSYGIQQKKLLRYNRLSAGAQVQPGTTLWLAAMKPKDSKAVPVNTDVVVLDETHAFAWTAQPTASQATVEPSIPEKTGEEKSAEPVIASEDSTIILQLTDTTTLTTVDSLKSVEQITTVIIKPEFHTVKAGETLYAIAKQYEVGVMDLVNWNGLNLQTGIQPGQVLKLSEGQPVAAERVLTPNSGKEIEHQVKASDTLYSIARQYGVTIKELMEWNGKKDFSLSVGEKLRIVQK